MIDGRELPSHGHGPAPYFPRTEAARRVGRKSYRECTRPLAERGDVFKSQAESSGGLKFECK